MSLRLGEDVFVCDGISNTANQGNSPDNLMEKKNREIIFVEAGTRTLDFLFTLLQELLTSVGGCS